MGGADFDYFKNQRKVNQKVIHDFPTFRGDKSSHLAEWKGENFGLPAKLICGICAFRERYR